MKCQFFFVDGDHPWPPSPDIAAIYGKEQEYVSYFDGSAASAVNTLDDLANYVIEEGPFDAVLGFSMGTMIAATLLLCPSITDGGRSAWADARSKIRSAIFFCGLQPMNSIELFEGGLERVKVDEVGSSGQWHGIQIPTLHVWSPQDMGNGRESKSLVAMCEEDVRAEILHGEGHTIPSRMDTVDEIVVAIAKMLSTLQS